MPMEWPLFVFNRHRFRGGYHPKSRAGVTSHLERSSMYNQRAAWEKLRMSITKLVRKLNKKNVQKIQRKLFKLNIVRGKGLFCQAIMETQANSMRNTKSYADLISFVNIYFPNIVELLLIRCIVTFKATYKIKSPSCRAPLLLIAHMIKHNIVDVTLAVEIVKLLLMSVTVYSTDLLYTFMEVCFQTMNDTSRAQMNAIFNHMQWNLYINTTSIEVEYLLNTMLKKYKYEPKAKQELEPEYQRKPFVHLMTLESSTDPQYYLDNFEIDMDFIANEKIYENMIQEIRMSETTEYDNAFKSDADDEWDHYEEKKKNGTDSKMFCLREVQIKTEMTIILDSTLNHQDRSMELLKINMKPNKEIYLYLDLCFRFKEYDIVNALTLQLLCYYDESVVKPLEKFCIEIFTADINLSEKILEHAGKLFAFLLSSDTLSWHIIPIIYLRGNNITRPNCKKFLLDELKKITGHDDFMANIKKLKSRRPYKIFYPNFNQYKYKSFIKFLRTYDVDYLM